MSDHTSTPMINSGWGRALLGLFIFLVLHGLLQFLAVLGFASFLSIPAAEIQSIALNAQAEYHGLVSITLRTFGLISTLIIVFALCRWIDKRNIVDLGFEISGRWPQIRQGLVLGGGLIAAGFLSLYWMDLLTIQGLQFNGTQLFVSFVLMLLVAFSEEMFFRGYLLKNLTESINKYVALGLTSLVFAVLHMLNPSWTWISMLNIALAGMVLGVFYIHRENLWFPIALHFSWNFFQGPIAGFEVSGLKIQSLIAIQVESTSWLTGGAFGFEGSILATILLVLTFFWLDHTYRQS